jgi:hypothetical protein
MDARSRKKKYETRKSINIIARICQSLDTIGEGSEYNLTVESFDLKTYINDLHRKPLEVSTVEEFKETIKVSTRAGKTAVLEGQYSSLITLRVTQHDGPVRYGPWYICIIAERDRYTYVPFCVELIGVTKTKTFTSLFRCYYTAETNEIVEKFVSVLEKLLKEKLK